MDNHTLGHGLSGVRAVIPWVGLAITARCEIRKCEKVKAFPSGDHSALSPDREALPGYQTLEKHSCGPNELGRDYQQLGGVSRE